MPEPEDPYDKLGIPRDRFGRPMVVPPGGGKPTPYTRCTTYVGVLEDTYNLSRWQQRMVALGLAKRPDLVLAAAAHHDDKEKLNDVCSSAMDAAAAGAAAGTGTALHKVTERLDLGASLAEVLADLPAAYRADVEAYARETSMLERVAVEQFVVNDALKVGGTPDLIVSLDGKRYVADKKTGSIEWGAGKIAMQLAMYSRSVFYDHDPDEPTRTPLEVEQDWGIVIHLPAGEGRCELHWVDLTIGWEDVLLAGKVRKSRSRKGHMRPFDAATLVREVFPEATKIDPAGVDYAAVQEAEASAIDLLGQIYTASVLELKRLYREHKDGAWADGHTAAAKARRAHLNLLEYISNANQAEELKGLYREHKAIWTDEHTELAAKVKARLHHAPLKRPRTTRAR